jgi:hypothetical protein
MASRAGDAAACSQDVCLTIPTLTDLLSFIDSVRQVVFSLFPKATAHAPYVARMGARGGVPIPIFVRLVWRSRHDGVKFEKTPVQLIQLRDIYLEWGFDPTTDKIFD